MIHNIKILGDATYLLNETVKLSIDEDLLATAEFDDNVMTKQEVEELIDDFFALAEKLIQQNTIENQIEVT